MTMLLREHTWGTRPDASAVAVVRQGLIGHQADRATVVRETPSTAGHVAPEVEPIAATVSLTDGSPRFVWTER
jgi:hypothetical protein